MAGGMNRRGSGVPLGQRVRVGGDGAGGDGADRDGVARHCWVADAVDGRGVRRPGLLVEWRRAAVGWEGRVVYAARLRPDAWVLVDEWVPAALLTPV